MNPNGTLRVGVGFVPIVVLAILTACAAGAALFYGSAYAWQIAATLGICFIALTLAGLQLARLDGSLLCLRTLATGFAARPVHARTVGALEFRRSPGPRRLRFVPHADSSRGGTLVLCARSADTASFRALTLWLIVHGRRGVHIHGALLDALASTHGHEGAGLPNDTSHA